MRRISHFAGVLGFAAVCAQGCSADDSAARLSSPQQDADASDASERERDATYDDDDDDAARMDAADATDASHDGGSELESDAIADAAASDAVVDADADAGGDVIVETWGYPTPFGSSQNVSVGSVLAYKITTSSTTTLDKFGLIAPQVGGDFKMALYTDASNAPGTLVYWIDTRQTAGAPGVAEVNVADQVLSAGSYWLAIRAAPSVTVGFSGVSPTATICSRNLAMMNLDTAWPVSFGAASCSTAGILNLYIVTYK